MQKRCCHGSKPDTGWSWVVCFAATICNLLQFGFSQCYGVFLPALSDHFKANREKTAWAGSIAIASTLFVGPIAVKLTQRFGHRVVSAVAGFTCALSLLVSSFVNHLAIMYFSYGVLFGVSGGTILNTGLTIVFKYFKKRRFIAAGITVSGPSIGVIVLAPILEALIESLTWKGAFRVMSGVMLLVCLLSLAYSPVIEEEDQGSDTQNNQAEDQEPRGGICSTVVLYFSVFKHIPYSVGTLAIVLTYFGLFVPNIHLVRFAKDLSISNRDASFLFIALGVCSALMRVLSGVILHRKWLTPLQSVQVSAFIISLSVILATLCKQYLHLVVFVVGSGLGNGMFVTSQMIFLQSILEPRLSAIGLGMGYMVSSIAVAGGPPFVGFIADETGSYIVSFYVVGGIVLLAVVLPFTLRCNTICKKRAVTTSIEEELKPTQPLKKDDVDHLDESDDVI